MPQHENPGRDPDGVVPSDDARPAGSSRRPWYVRPMSESDANTDDPAVEATLRIGKRLAYLRGARGLKISDLARRIGVSPSLISQVERGQSRPSVTTLFALAQQLEVPVDAFFESGAIGETSTTSEPTPAPGPATAALVRAPGPAPPSNRDLYAPPWPDEGAQSHRYLLHHRDRPVLEIRGGVRWERLTRSPLEDIEFMELVYQPGAESDPQLYRHPGLECVLVTDNLLEITVGFEVNRVMAGDSIAFPSTMPHRYQNPTDRVSRAVTVIVRDDLSALRGKMTSSDTGTVEPE